MADSGRPNIDTYAIECQKCGHAWLAAVETIRARERSAMCCPVCEPLGSSAPRPITAARALVTPVRPARLSPELGGKTWVITRARRARV